MLVLASGVNFIKFNSLKNYYKYNVDYIKKSLSNERLFLV